MSNIKQRIKFLEADAKHHDVKSSSIMLVSTRTVLAIVEAFRELDVSVQAAAAIISELKESLAASGKMQQLHREAAQAAEAQLAELAKQEPVLFRDSQGCFVSKGKGERLIESGEYVTPYYLRPAPAAGLDELENNSLIDHLEKCSAIVASWPEWKKKGSAATKFIQDLDEFEIGYLNGHMAACKSRPAPAAVPVDLVPGEMPTSHIYHGGSGAFNAGKESGWNACRAEMLRRIEDNKK